MEVKACRVHGQLKQHGATTCSWDAILKINSCARSDMTQHKSDLKHEITSPADADKHCLRAALHDRRPRTGCDTMLKPPQRIAYVLRLESPSLLLIVFPRDRHLSRRWYDGS